MLIKKKKRIKIVTVDMSSLRIYRARREHTDFVVDCGFDIQKAVKHEAYNLEISVSRVPANRSKKNYFEGAKSSRKINSVIKKKAKSKRTARASALAKPEPSKLDITAIIPNTDLKSIKSGKKIKKLELKFNAGNSGVPTVDMSLPASSQAESDQGMGSSFPTPGLCKSIIKRFNVDPSLLSSRDFPVQRPEKSFAGVREYDGQTTLTAHSAEARKLFTSEVTLGIAGQMVFGKNTQTGTTRAPVAVPEYRQTNIVTKTAIFGVKLQDMQGNSKVYITFSLKDIRGNIVQEFERSFNYRTLLDEYYSPPSPPGVTASWIDDTTVLLSISRGTAKTRSVQIYTRYIDNERQHQNSGWSLVEKKRVGSAPYMCTIKLNSKYTQIIRAIGIGRYGTHTCEFTTVTLEPRPKTLRVVDAGQSSRINTIDDSVSVFQKRDGLLATVKNIPEYVVHAVLLRKNRTTNEKKYTAVPGASARAFKMGDSSFTTFDRSVQHGHVYCYRCEYTTALGNKLVSLNEPSAEYLSPQFDSESFSIGPVNSRHIRGVYSASFLISDPIQPANTSAVISDMFAGSIISTTAISTALLEETSEENLYAYMVERIDTTTGETESFGILGKGPFVDDRNTRAAAGVSEPDASHGYTYNVSLCKRSPTSLIDGAKIDDVDQIRSVSFARDHSKTLNPSSMRLGAIVPTAGRFSKPSATLPVEVYDGRTGIKSSVNVSGLHKKTSTIKKLTVTSRKRYNYITWEWSGKKSQVDHFLIMAQYGNVKAPVASVHSLGEYSHYYKDHQLASHVGEVKYSIVPVGIDYSYGKESNSVTVTKRISR